MKTPAMKTPALATVYLDNANVGLMGDPRPRVSKIVAASGRHPSTVRVIRTQSSSDQKGTPVSMEDIIDRTAEPTRPIYLLSRPNAVPIEVPEKPAPSSSTFIEFPSSQETGRKPLGDPLADDPLRRGGRRD
jgi:hypothetical protein